MPTFYPIKLGLGLSLTISGSLIIMVGFFLGSFISLNGFLFYFRSNYTFLGYDLTVEQQPIFKIYRNNDNYIIMIILMIIMM